MGSVKQHVASGRKVLASAYAGSLQPQMQEMQEQTPNLWGTLVQMFVGSDDKQVENSIWDGVPPEYLHDHSEHGGWTHSHIADRLANEPASMVHRAFDQAASDL